MSTAPPAPSTRLRTRVERASLPLLTRLHAVPRLLVPLATLALVALGAFAPLAVALLALLVVLLFIAWIAYLSWPVVGWSGRLIRVAMILLVVGLAATRF